MLKRLRKNKKGFTLVEVIVVAVIVAILAAVAVPLYLGYIQNSRMNSCSNAAGALASFIASAKNSGAGTADITNWALTVDNTVQLVFDPDGDGDDAPIARVNFQPPSNVRLTIVLNGADLVNGGTTTCCFDANVDGDCADNLEIDMMDLDVVAARTVIW